ncbi:MULTISPECIES: type III glutamate--ammonia ligase [Tatumella]|uniref:Type III glutamate--ammonia ligase n=1 Tax=Tatumella punctata TaxID=399969 RepID=A0ABW1VLE1_9GAMM|nr:MULTISPECIES: type III glutamate--ammonia ligase [unclassified Tatumella]MBS0855528.1 type III glutamate--ammonia ligase [Tatumella sp. JGM16]MBS0877090.1 type III glutamate--ammonia ligase [Tatumella sp. JGM82]MBS0890642.1 type III glutamate--ammonia ligase [Tatumella sp. JGM94]MBS0893314.1 type III glutamate--ammonia ligase [Tatumella sp. JGM130]MBS0901393.1 type III glutamate--ammonia ligase [Tatumella sp. JGM100]
MSPEQAMQFLQDNNVRYLLAQFVDIHGAAKTKSVPAKCLMDVVEKGAGFAGFAISGMGMQPNGPDFSARGDLTTLSLVPWQPGYARIVCNGYVNNQPHNCDSRVVLLKQVARLQEKGWVLNSGLEPEFSLFRRGENGEILPADNSDTLAKPCYDYKGLSRVRPFLEKLTESLQGAGFDVYQIDHEDANGQFEINYTYSDALTSADRFTFVRMAAAEIAYAQNLLCSFMPKPFADRPGNGMHFHLSMSDHQGNNIFYDPNDPRGLGLSKMAYHFMAGMLHHAKALCAFAAPTVNSYKRLTGGGSATGATWAPVFITYGDNNRSAMIRIPHGRLELRLPDTGANPYLVHAAIIAAGLDGVARQLDPGKGQSGNLYAFTPQECRREGIELLPQNLKEALDELERDEILRESMGPEIVDEFIKVKRQEWHEYHRHVSEWETRRYLEFF